jgi:phosphomannomutase/phosphoglucomutase
MTLERENLDKVFKAYDVRGVVEKEIDGLLVFAIGYALGKLYPETEVVVGHDSRKHSEKFAKEFIRGLNVFGVVPKFIGLCTTPMLYFAVSHLKAKLGVMITASHNPKEYNGVKISKTDEELSREEWENIKEIILECREEIENLFSENGDVKFERENILKGYKYFVKGFSKSLKLKVVIDGADSFSGIVAKEVLEELGCDVTCVACEIDPNFSSHDPDPVKEVNTELCKQKVVEVEADLGICFDGDGDRVIFIDDKGRYISGDYGLAILSMQFFGKPFKVVTEVKASKAVIEFIESHGGKIIMERVGRPFIKKRMKEENADIGGELSGHYFFKGVAHDDGLVTVIKMLSLLEEKQTKLSKLFDFIPKYFASPEYRIECGEEEKFKIVEDAKKYFEKYGKNVIDIDGVRVEFENGWGLLRASNTEPKISLRFEAKTKEEYERILRLFSDFLVNYGLIMR